MSKSPKTPLTPQQLVDKMVDQGLIVTDRGAAANFLQHVGAFRLKGYWFHLQSPHDKRFADGTTFDNIVSRYEFDRKLRALVFEAVERLEVAVRSAMANHLSLRYGPHWYLDHKIFKPTREWGMGALLKKIEDEVGRSKAIFIEKHRHQPGSHYLPHSWAVSECVTFAFWSRTYAIIENNNDRKAISMKFGIEQPEVFESWLHSLSYIRNMVAHHSRILRFPFAIAPQNYKKKSIKISKKNFYAIATVINVMLQGTKLQNSWKSDLLSLFTKHPDINIESDLGFSPGWENAAGW